MSRARYCAVALIAVAAVGCRKKPPPPPPPVAVVDAGPKEETLPYAAQILAMSIAPPSIHWLDEREMVLEMGMYFHNVDAKGGITPIGKPIDYARFLPDIDDDMGGYDVGTFGQVSRVSGSQKRLFITRFHPDDVVLWDGASWSKAIEAPPAYEVDHARWMSDPMKEGADAGSSILPSGKNWRSFLRLKDGRALWIGDTEHRAELALVDKAGTNARLLTAFEPQKDSKGAAAFRCQAIPSRDGTAWLDCAEYDPDWGERFKQKVHIVRLEGDEFREVSIPEPSYHARSSNYAVDDEGTLWYSEQSHEPRLGTELVRVPRTGGFEKHFIPHPPSGLARPSYAAEAIATRAKATGDSPYRNWSVARIRPPRDESPDLPPVTRWVERVVPRPNGDVLILARDSNYMNLVIRFARGAKPIPNDRILISGSPDDQRNEIRNARPPRTWVGHCPQIFVSLGKDTAKVLAREADIADVIKKAHRPKKSAPQAAIIEGKLGGAPVVGVAVLRTYPDVREEDVEATASRLIERFTSDPSSPPAATCTLPVLEKVHKDYPSQSENLAF